MSETASAAATLLLVDDEASILSALRRLLRPAGYRILTAEGGQAGLDILGREAVDLVISDMRMPGMDGAKFLEQVRQRWPDVMRLLLTGHADVSATIEAINLGEIYRYIAKPWDDDDLLMTIRGALEHRRLAGENARLLELTRHQNETLVELNAGLERKVRERTAEIEQALVLLHEANDRLKKNFVVSIKMFSGLIELRAGAMAGHSRRVADLARRLAVQLGVDTRDQHDLLLAALLHDIGKIGFPDRLLGSPVSRMSVDDLALYRKHPLTGASALMPLDELKGAARLVRSHHERFDGQGFPDGLVGLGIPLGARIIALASDFDALQQGELTDKPVSERDAMALVASGRGKRYDPQVVDALLELLGTPRPEHGREHESAGEQAVSSDRLKPGMVLARDLHGADGVLLLATDYVLDADLIQQIQLYARREGAPLVLHIRAQ